MDEDLDSLVEEKDDGYDDIDVPFDVDDEVKTDKVVTKSSDGAIELNKEKFATLINVLQIIKMPTCQDVDINNGIIRQYNETKNIMINIDLTNILGNSTNLKMSGIEQKFNMLEPFRNQNVDVIAQVTENTYAFMDNISRLSYHQGLKEYMSNSFITDEKYNNSVSCGKRVFEKVIGKAILQRISIYSKALVSEVIKIKFDKTKAHFELTPKDGASPAIASVFTIEDELEETNLVGKAVLPIDPFLFCLGGGITELKIEMFHKKGKNATDNEYLIKISGKLIISGSDDEVPINIWLRTILVDI